MLKLDSMNPDDENGSGFGRRQLPINIDETLTMIMKLDETCIDYDNEDLQLKDLEVFNDMLNIVSREELQEALMVNGKDMFSQLSQQVPCVGCRRSMECMFNQFVESGEPILEPLIITHEGVVSVCSEYLSHPRELCGLLYGYRQEFEKLIDSLHKSRKNRRCHVHSLESQRLRPSGCWLDTWEQMSPRCREEVARIEFSMLYDTVESYLKKHRFCLECQCKVKQAYEILTGMLDPPQENFLPSLYSGIKAHVAGQHLHVPSDVETLDQLISRAEPDLLGNNRERHAKTLDIAQEEVLTCLGIYLFERFHRIGQKVKEEEQTWNLLFCISVEALKKNLECFVERKQGVSRLELLCEEITREEAAKQLKREQKKLKKKKRQEKKMELEGKEEVTTLVEVTSQSSCQCEVKNTVNKGAQKSGKVVTHKNNTHQHISVNEQKSNTSTCRSCNPPQQSKKKKKLKSATDKNSHISRHDADCGYGSCTPPPSSPEGSEIAFSEGCCSHDGDCLSRSSNSSTHSCDGESSTREELCSMSLQQMLDNPSFADEETYIPIEEVRQFKAKSNHVAKKRRELRKTLEQRFAKLCSKDVVAK